MCVCVSAKPELEPIISISFSGALAVWVLHEVAARLTLASGKTLCECSHALSPRGWPAFVCGVMASKER